MKVAERDTNRTAEVHICVEGRLYPLEEYGQYVDPTDGALCCYVAVEEGEKIKFDGRFDGTTLIVAYDAVVDGVCRKANSYVGKSVRHQKYKKLDFDTFLYKTPNGVIDAKMAVAAYPGRVDLNKAASETTGTLELRVYITRQFNVEHDIDETQKYHKVSVGADASTQIAVYKDVPPQFHMIFEENSPTLEDNRERGKINKKRPGTQPWAIFRFHYRTEESILKKNMQITFDHTDKASKKEHHLLELEPLPMLLVGSNPADQHDGENSVHTSSPAPSDTRSAPTTGFKKSQAKQVGESLSSPKASRKQSTTSASTGPHSGIKTSKPTPDKSASGDVLQPALQAQETGDSVISSTLHIGSDVGVRGKNSVKTASDTLQKLNTTSADPNHVTFRESITPTVPEPTDKPNGVETTTPVKRAPEGVFTPPPDTKRIKTDVLPRNPWSFSPSSVSVSPSPRSRSVEMQLAEKRQQLETTRKLRAEMAKKRTHVEERLAPHKQRIAEELQRLKQELAEEEAMMAEEEQDYKASQMLLAEFEGDDSIS